MSANSSKRKRGSANAVAPANGLTEMKDVITQMESFIKEAEALAAMEIRRIEEIKESLKTTVTRLAAQFKEKEEVLRARDKVARELEENFSAKVRDLEKRLTEKEALLESHKAALAEAEAKSAPSGSGSKAGIPQYSESSPSIRELEEGLLRRAQAAKREEESEVGVERSGSTTETKGSRAPLRELETRLGKIDKKDPDQNSLRLVSLLGPIKRKS